jgi:SAM-dependent methyltransferase
LFDEERWRVHADGDGYAGGEEFCKFIRDLAGSLRAESALEVGCSAGGDLRLFDPRSRVCGVDLSGYAVERAQARFPDWEFKVAPAADLPYGDASFDFVFTHRLLNHLDDGEVDGAVSELFRVSGKYVVNCELFGEDGVPSEGLRLRDAFSRWLDYKVKVISNVDMHEEIEPGKARFTLVRKV